MKVQKWQKDLGAATTLNSISAKLSCRLGEAGSFGQREPSIRRKLKDKGS